MTFAHWWLSQWGHPDWTWLIPVALVAAYLAWGAWETRASDRP